MDWYRVSARAEIGYNHMSTFELWYIRRSLLQRRGLQRRGSWTSLSLDVALCLPQCLSCLPQLLPCSVQSPSWLLSCRCRSWKKSCCRGYATARWWARCWANQGMEMHVLLDSVLLDCLWLSWGENFYFRTEVRMHPFVLGVDKVLAVHF